jgi:hypothetical protein
MPQLLDDGDVDDILFDDILFDDSGVNVPQQ